VNPQNTPFPRTARGLSLLIVKKVRFLNSYPPITARQSPRRKRFRAFLTLEVKRTTPISREFRCFYNVIRFVNPQNTPFPRMPRGFLPQFRCFYNVIRFVNPQNTQFPRPPHGFSANSVVFTTEFVL